MRKLKKLLRLLPNSLYRRGLRYGVAAAVEHTAFLSLRRFSTVIDAGANKGQFALAVRSSQPKAIIVAFEPLSQPAATFRRLFAGAEGVIFHNVALGAISGVGTINVSGRPDSSSLLPIGELQDRVFPGTEAVGKESIQIERLDDFAGRGAWREPVLLKIDVQGFELTLLQGAERSLPKIDAVYVELSFVEFYEGQALAWEVIDWLRQRGLNLTGVYNMAYDQSGRAIQADFSFERNS